MIGILLVTLPIQTLLAYACVSVCTRVASLELSLRHVRHSPLLH